MILLVIDTQKEIVTKELYNYKNTIKNIQKLIKNARDNKVEVVYVRHDDGVGCSLHKGQPGYEIDERMQRQENEKIFDKYSNSAFKDTGLLSYLKTKQIKTIMMVGLQTDYCMDASVKAGFEHGFKVIVPADANSTVDNDYLSGEQSYHYYNEMMWPNRYATCLSIEASLLLLKERVIIRQETKKDYHEVEKLTRDVFWNIYQPGCVEHYLLHQLRKDPCFVTELDYLIEKDNQIISHIAYAKAYVDKQEILIFGPVSVSPSYQHCGYGTMLIRYTMQKAKELGYHTICITGNPDYYHRFGFETASKYQILYNGLNEDAPYFMVKFLSDDHSIKGCYQDPDVYHCNVQEVAVFDQAFPCKQKETNANQLRKMEMSDDLLTKLDKLHTTELGVERIKKNLSLTTCDVVNWCKQEIIKEEAKITRKGKNWYVAIDGCIITINAHSYTIITAHKQ